MYKAKQQVPIPIIQQINENRLLKLSNINNRSGSQFHKKQLSH